jgi:putative transcriptional regulator
MNECVRNTVSELRRTHNVTQEALAKAISVSRQTIIALEKGNYTPSILLALRIAKYFKVPVEEIFTQCPNHDSK